VVTSVITFYVLCLHGGHTDVVMGAVILNDDEMAVKLRFLQNGEQLFLDHPVEFCLATESIIIL